MRPLKFIFCLLAKLIALGLVKEKSGSSPIIGCRQMAKFFDATFDIGTLLFHRILKYWHDSILCPQRQMSP